MRRGSNLLGAGLVLGLLALAAPAGADHLDELILFDQSGAEKKLDEGFARQRLGLLNADGRPALPLVPMVSADGKRQAYDMNGAGTNPSFDTRLTELKGDGGSLIIVTHGNTGVLTMEQVLVKGFGAGTGSTEACAQAALPVTRVLRNVVIRMVVCHAARAANPVTAVSQSLRDAVVAAGGSVATLTASQNTTEVRARQRARIRDGYNPTAMEAMNVVAAVQGFSVGGRAFASQYADYQAAINAAAPPDGQGAKIIGVLVYEADIDGTVLTKAPSTHPDPVIRSIEDLDVVIRDSACAENCTPVAAQPASWTGVKAVYR